MKFTIFNKNKIITYINILLLISVISFSISANTSTEFESSSNKLPVYEAPMIKRASYPFNNQYNERLDNLNDSSSENYTRYQRRKLSGHVRAQLAREFNLRTINEFLINYESKNYKEKDDVDMVEYTMNVKVLAIGMKNYIQQRSNLLYKKLALLDLKLKEANILELEVENVSKHRWNISSNSGNNLYFKNRLEDIINEGASVHSLWDSNWDYLCNIVKLQGNFLRRTNDQYMDSTQVQQPTVDKQIYPDQEFYISENKNVKRFGKDVNHISNQQYNWLNDKHHIKQEATGTEDPEYFRYVKHAKIRGKQRYSKNSHKMLGKRKEKEIKMRPSDQVDEKPTEVTQQTFDRDPKPKNDVMEEVPIPEPKKGGKGEKVVDDIDETVSEKTDDDIMPKTNEASDEEVSEIKDERENHIKAPGVLGKKKEHKAHKGSKGSKVVKNLKKVNKNHKKKQTPVTPIKDTDTDAEEEETKVEEDIASKPLKKEEEKEEEKEVEEEVVTKPKPKHTNNNKKVVKKEHKKKAEPKPIEENKEDEEEIKTPKEDTTEEEEDTPKPKKVNTESDDGDDEDEQPKEKKVETPKETKEETDLDSDEEESKEEKDLSDKIASKKEKINKKTSANNKNIKKQKQKLDEIKEDKEDKDSKPDDEDKDKDSKPDDEETKETKQKVKATKQKLDKSKTQTKKQQKEASKLAKSANNAKKSKEIQKELKDIEKIKTSEQQKHTKQDIEEENDVEESIRKAGEISDETKAKITKKVKKMSTKKAAQLGEVIAHDINNLSSDIKTLVDHSDEKIQEVDSYKKDIEGESVEKELAKQIKQKLENDTSESSDSEDSKDSEEKEKAKEDLDKAIKESEEVVEKATNIPSEQIDKDFINKEKEQSDSDSNSNSNIDNKKGGKIIKVDKKKKVKAKGKNKTNKLVEKSEKNPQFTPKVQAKKKKKQGAKLNKIVGSANGDGVTTAKTDTNTNANSNKRKRRLRYRRMVI